MNDMEKLTQIKGVGPKLASRVLDHFEDGHEAASSACRYWNEWTKINGVSEDMAKDMFHRMKDAGVFEDLRGY